MELDRAPAAAASAAKKNDNLLDQPAQRVAGRRTVGRRETFIERLDSAAKARSSSSTYTAA